MSTWQTNQNSHIPITHKSINHCLKSSNFMTNTIYFCRSEYINYKPSITVNILYNFILLFCQIKLMIFSNVETAKKFSMVNSLNGKLESYLCVEIRTGSVQICSVISSSWMNFRDFSRRFSSFWKSLPFNFHDLFKHSLGIKYKTIFRYFSMQQVKLNLKNGLQIINKLTLIKFALMLATFFDVTILEIEVSWEFIGNRLGI
jgi:hypothetical protein